MTSMQILTWPHPMLTRRATPVPAEEIVTDGFYAKCEALARTMLEANGLGLAATQIGWNAAVFVLAQHERLDDQSVRLRAGVYVNPKILETDGNEAEDEGCLSFPGVRELLHGPTRLALSFTTLHGESSTRVMHGWEARAAFHECQHLEGKTMLNRMGNLRRRMFLQRYAKAKARAA